MSDEVLTQEEAIQFIKDTQWSAWVQDEEVCQYLTRIHEITMDPERAANVNAGENGPGAVDDSQMKVIVVGDGAVGKTCLLVVYAEGKFPEEYVPTTFDNYSKSIEVHGKSVDLHLVDTAGQEEYDRIRAISYADCDAVLICFSTTNSNTLEAVQSKWAPEASHFLPNATKILVGTKIDMRDEGIADTVEGATPVSTDEGKEMSKKLSCDKYIEVSAKTGKGLNKLFDGVVELIYKKRHPNASDDGAAEGSSASSGSAAAAGGKGDKKEEGDGKKKKKDKKDKKDKGCVLQ